MSEEMVFWDCNEQTETLHYDDIDSAIEHHLDDVPIDEWPETLDVYGFQRIKPKWERIGQRVLDDLLEQLDDEYGSPDEATIQTPEMAQAAKEFIGKISAAYEIWSYEVKTTKQVNVMEWVKEHAAHWLDEHGCLRR